MQEVSSMLLGKLVAAGIGDRPVVFVTHRFVGCSYANFFLDAFLWAGICAQKPCTWLSHMLGIY